MNPYFKIDIEDVVIEQKYTNDINLRSKGVSLDSNSISTLSLVRKNTTTTKYSVMMKDPNTEHKQKTQANIYVCKISQLTQQRDSFPNLLA